MSSTHVTLIAIALFALSACGGNGQKEWPFNKQPGDAGIRASDTIPATLLADRGLPPSPDRGLPPSPDRGLPPSPDRGLPPSSDSGPGLPQADQGVPADLWAPKCTVAVVGRPCDKVSDCGNVVGVECLQQEPGKSGVCSCRCTPDDPNTSANEDDCPGSGPGQTVCGTIQLNAAQQVGYCLKRCSPRLGANSCTAPLACRLDAAFKANVWGDYSVCMLEGCKTNDDCPVFTETRCDAKTPCASGQRCHEQGLCVLDGNCDAPSGLCAPRKTIFNPAATIGAPCKKDADCGAAMACLQESTAQQRGEKAGGAACTKDTECCSGLCQAKLCAPGPCLTTFRNGYCSIVGCAFPTLLEARCPAGSTCNRAYWGGYCQKTCNLTSAGSCRAVAADKFGDYECRAWDRMSVAGVALADSPVCDFGLTITCSAYPGNCNWFGDTSNSTNMKCRDLNNTPMSTNSNFGFCLDDTASGPL